MNTLKEQILNNEKILLKNFSEQYGLAIQFFIKKIEALDKDGDIVKFLNNKCILSIKKDQYDLFHKNGYKTAIDIKNEYDKTNLEYSRIENLEKDELVNTMMISVYANNFNSQKGMYYNQDDDILILKCQVKKGQYDDRWTVRNKEMIYFLQDEKENIRYINKEFKHVPNQICRDIIENKNTHTKVYLFFRYSSGDRYFFAGECKIEGFLEGNKAIKISVL